MPRPKILEAMRKSSTILEAEQWERLRVIARAEKISVARLIRIAVDRYLKRRKT